MDAIDGMIAKAKEALDRLTDLLPGSEPKDPTSPLRGLGKRGEAMMGNFVGGAVDAAPAAASQMSGALATVAGPPSMGGSSYSSSSVGDTAVTINGSGLSEGALERVVNRVLDARAGRADRLARTGGGSA